MLAPKAHSFRCSSSSQRTRSAGLRWEPSSRKLPLDVLGILEFDLPIGTLHFVHHIPTEDAAIFQRVAEVRGDGVSHLKDEQGKRKPKWIPTGIPVGGKKNEKAAQDMLLEVRYSYKEPIICTESKIAGRVTGNMLFADYMLHWLSIIKNSVEEVTYAGYETNVKNRIAPYFRQLGVSLSELSALDIETFYEYCFNELKIKGSIVRHFHANIHKALKYAVKHDLIVANPMD